MNSLATRIGMVIALALAPLACAKGDEPKVAQESIDMGRLANAVYDVEYPPPAANDLAALEAWGGRRAPVVAELTQLFSSLTAQGPKGERLRKLTAAAYVHLHPEPKVPLGHPQMDAHQAAFARWQDDVLDRFKWAK